MGFYNDKVMLTPRRYLEKALRGPHELALQVESGSRDARCTIRRVSKPESFLWAVLEKWHVPVSQVDADVLPFVDGRCAGVRSDAIHSTLEDSKRWCLVPSWKDCRPQGATELETCLAK